MEGHRADLEREPHKGEEDRHREQRRQVGARSVRADLAQQRRAGQPEDERHAVQHHGRRQHAEEVVLDRGLVRLRVVLPPARQHVRRHGDQLERHEDRDEIPGRCHHDHPEHGAEQQEVVLALVVVALADVVDRHEQRDVRHEEEEALQSEGVVVHHVRPAEHRARRPVGGQRQDRHQRCQHTDRGEARRLEPLTVAEEEVGDEHDDDRRREDDLGRERVVVEDGVHGELIRAPSPCRARGW